MRKTMIVLVALSGVTFATPITNGMPAHEQWGQPDFNTGYVDWSVDQFFGARVPSSSSLFSASDVAFDGTDRLFVADLLNGRVLVIDATPNQNLGSNATMVLGQPFLGTGNSNPGDPYGNWNTQNVSEGCTTDVNACGMRRAWGVDYANGFLYVSDPDNSRVLVWNMATASSGSAASFVLGQQNFETNTRRLGCDGTTVGVDACGLSTPFDITYDSVRDWVWVVDSANHRVVAYDAGSLSNGASAVAVLGQANLTSSDENAGCGGGSAGTVNACGLSSPEAVTFDATNNRLYVFDGGNSRVLIYDLATVSDGEAAANVLGQPNFATGTANTDCGGGASGDSNTNQCGLGIWAGQIAVQPSENRLFVSDASNHRTLVFDISSITNGEQAVRVLGQPDFSSGYNASSSSFGGATDAVSYVIPMGVSFDDVSDRLFLADSGNHRVMVYGPNVGGAIVEPQGDTVSVETEEHPDGSVSITQENSEGDSFTVTLPPGTDPQNGNANIEIFMGYFNGDRNAPGVRVEADLPPGQTKSITLANPSPDLLCVQDTNGNAIGGVWASCPSNARVTPPAAGNTVNKWVYGSPEGWHQVQVTTSADGSTCTISGLNHTILGATPANAPEPEGNYDAQGCSANSTSSGALFMLATVMLLGVGRQRFAKQV